MHALIIGPELAARNYAPNRISLPCSQSSHVSFVVVVVLQFVFRTSASMYYIATLQGISMLYIVSAISRTPVVK